MSDVKICAEKQKQIEELKDWAIRQPHISKDIEDHIYLRFLHSCYYDLEKTKITLELFFSIRNSSPELMCNRDPLSPDIQKLLKVSNIAQYSISGNRNLWLWQINDPNLDIYDYTLDAKLFILAVDAWMLSNEILEESDVVVFDIKDISLKFLTKFSVPVARKLVKYQEEALPVRLKEIHVVNCPPFVDMLYAILKPFVKKSSSMLHFHTPNSDTLYKFLDKEELPADLEGTREKLEDISKVNKANLIALRERLIDPNLWRVQVKQTKNSDFSTEVGTFRTLAID